MLFSKKEDLSILVFIGTNRVSSAFVLSAKDKKPRIITSIKELFLISEKIDSQVLTQNMLGLLEESISKLIKKGASLSEIKNNRDIKAVYVTISSPWYVSRIKNINLHQDKNFIVTEDFIQNVLDVEEKKFESELSSGEYEKDFGQNLSILENTFTDSRANGYKVKNVIGKKTNDLDISIYSTLAGKNLVNTVGSILHKHTHIDEKRIRFNTAPLSFFHILGEIDPKMNSYLLLDITGEITDLTLIHDGSITQSISFPSGRNFILRQIAKDFGVSFEIAESILNMFNLKNTDSTTYEGVVKVLDDVRKEWSIYLTDTLNELSKNTVLPHKMCIITDSDVYPIFESFIDSIDYFHNEDSKNSFDLTRVGTDLLSYDCDFDKSSIYDEYLAMSAIFHLRQI